MEGRTVYARHGLEPFDAVLAGPLLPDAFNEKRYPQMLERLCERRERHGTCPPELRAKADEAMERFRATREKER